MAGRDGRYVLSVDPVVAVSLLALAICYAVGVMRLWEAAGVGQGIRRREAAAFACGWFALAVALVSPLDGLGSRLFSAHMVQHELLMLVAAPLIVLGSPAAAFAWMLPERPRRRTFAMLRRRRLIAAWTAASAPAAVWLLHATALWVWHLPSLFQATLESDAVHAAQHLSFFGSAALFWWGLTHGRYGRIGYGAAVVYVFTTAMHSGVLGALLTFAPTVWYPAYEPTTAGFGLTPLEDQQLGGLIMWVPAGVVYVIVGLGFFAAWLKEAERRSRFGADATRSAQTGSKETGAGRRKASVVSFLSFVAVVVVLSAACSREVYRNASAMTGGNPVEGRGAIARYGCDTCHTIPGVRTAHGQVGPPLTGIAARVYIAGHVPNTPGNMENWIRTPHGLEPHTAMPETGVTETDARNIVAYLYTLR